MATLRFLLLGDSDSAVRSFDRFASAVNDVNKAVARANAAMVVNDATTSRASAAVAKMSDRLTTLNRQLAEQQALRIDDAGASAKLFGLQRQAEKLRDILGNESISIEGMSGAMAKLLALEAAASRLDEGGGAGGGILGGLFGAAGGAAPLAGMAAAAGGAPLAIAGTVAGAATVASGALGIIPLITAATAGVAAFGGLAIPTITAVSGAITALSTDTAAYKAAVGDVAKDAALKKIRADWMAISPAQRQIVRGVQRLQTAYDGMAAKLDPITTKILGVAVKIADKLLPLALPFAKVAGGAILGLLKQFDRFAGSAGFKSFMANMLKLSGPAITTIGRGIGRVAGAIGKLLIALESPNGLRALRVLFDVVQWTVAGIAKAFEWLTPRVIRRFEEIARATRNVRGWLDTAWRAFEWFGGQVVRFGDDLGSAVEHAFNAVNHWIDTLAGWISRFFGTMIPHWISVGISWFKGLPGRIVAAVGDLSGLLVNAGRSVIDGLISGIKSAIGGVTSVLGSITHLIPSWKGPLNVDRMLLFGSGQAIMQGFMGGIGSQVPALHGQLAAITGSVRGPAWSPFDGGGSSGQGAGRESKVEALLTQAVALLDEIADVTAGGQGNVAAAVSGAPLAGAGARAAGYRAMYSTRG